MPVGTNVPFEMLRLEYQATSGPRYDRFYIDYGFMVGWDATIALEGFNGGETRGSLDVSYNFLPPLYDTAPGISVGVRDLTDNSVYGRAGYFAVTMHFGNSEDVNQDVPTELTFGAWTRHGGSGFIGASLPFSTQWRALFEADKETINAGLEYKPDPDLALKWFFEDGRPSFGLTLQRRF